MADESPPQEQPPPEQQAQAQPQAQEQQFYRQYLQSTAPDGTSTIREIVSPNLLDHDAAIAAEKQAGYTFKGFVDPAKWRRAPAQPAAAPPPAAAALDAAPRVGCNTCIRGRPDHLQRSSPGARPVGAMARGNAQSGRAAGLLAMAQHDTAGPGNRRAARACHPSRNSEYRYGSRRGGWRRPGAGVAKQSVRSPCGRAAIREEYCGTQGLVSGATDVGMSQVVNPYVLGPPASNWPARSSRKRRRGFGAGAYREEYDRNRARGVGPAATAPRTSLHPIDLATSTPQGMQVLAKQATAEERPALAAAWVAARRAEAANSGDPVGYMRRAYGDLGAETQQALFGVQKGAYERLLQTAWGGTSEEMKQLVMRGVGSAGAVGAVTCTVCRHVPGRAMTRAAADVVAPFAGRGMLMSPAQARFGAGLSRFGNVAGPAVSNLAAQSVAERARQAGLPTF